ncbi:hypothetical protein D3C81_10290 [compost metagenome]
MIKQVILISQNNYDLEGIKIVQSFKNIDWGTVSTLIFHSTSDTSLETIKELSNIKTSVGKVLYINKSITPIYYCIFTGLNADIYDDEEYLKNTDTLNYLIDTYKENQLALQASDNQLETIANCIAALSDANMSKVEKLLGNKFWVGTLNTAVDSVGTRLSMANQINIDVIEMLEQTSDLIANFEKDQDITGEEIEKLKRLVESAKINKGSNSVFDYPSYPVPLSIPKVLFIKVLGPCVYLNTCMLMYQDYLKNSKQCSSKLLLAYPKLPLYATRYEKLPRLASDSIAMLSRNELGNELLHSSYYVTADPKKKVLDAFFNLEAEVFIVIDMMYSESILNSGFNVETFYALSGLQDIKKYNKENIPTNRLIMYRLQAGDPKTGTDNIALKAIKSYSALKPNQRISHYVTNYIDIFKKLDSILLGGS